MKVFTQSLLLLLAVGIYDSLGFSPSSLKTGMNTMKLHAADSVKPEEFAQDVGKLVNGLSEGKIPPNEFEYLITEKTEAFSQKQKEQDQELRLASVIGSSIIGLGTGAVADIYVPGDIILPVVSAVVLGGGAYYIATDKHDSTAKEALYTYVGKNTIIAGDIAKEKLNEFVEGQKKAAEKKKQDVIEYFKSIPRRTQQAFFDAVDGAKSSVAKKLVRTRDRILAYPNEVVKGVQRKAVEAVEDVFAAPLRIQRLAVKKVEDFKEEVVSFPKKVVNDVVSVIKPEKVSEEEVAKAVQAVDKIFKSANEVPVPVPKEESVVDKLAEKIPFLSSLGFSKPRSTAAKTEAKAEVIPKTAAKKVEVKDNILAAFGLDQKEKFKPEPSPNTAPSKSSPGTSAKPTEKPSLFASLGLGGDKPAPKVAVSPASSSKVTTPTPISAPEKPASGSFFNFGKSTSDKGSASPLKPVTTTSRPSVATSKKPTTTIKKPTIIINTNADAEAKPEVKKVVVPVAPAPAPVTSPVAAPAPLAIKQLSSDAIATLKKAKASESTIGEIDQALIDFNNGKLSSDQLYSAATQVLRSKDKAFEVLPYLVGSLPRGPRKTALNNFYQQRS
eukprot:gene9212-10172_t